MIKLFLIGFITYAILKQMYTNVPMQSTEIQVWGDFSEFKFKRSRWWQRLFHVSLDTFVLLLLFSNFIFVIPDSAIVFLDNTFGDRYSGYVIFFVVSTIFYMIYEGTLKATPGKYLTDSKVVPLKNKPISFETMLGRTLCRRIPFNALSFLSPNGWHDFLSHTTVSTFDIKREKGYSICNIVLLIIILAIFAYSIIRDF